MDKHEKNLWPNGFKKTRQRLEIFEALREAQRPVTAREICLSLERRGRPMWLSTIYRVLDMLVEHGVAQKSDMGQNAPALYEMDGGHRHYAVCMACQCIVAVEGCPFEAFAPRFKDNDFHVLGHKLQFSGYCGDCYKKNGGD